MNAEQENAATWILVVSALFAVLEIAVSISILLSPEDVLEQVDFTARGVTYLSAMWAARQFALGVVLAFSTYKKSAPMLTICYLFLLLMFAGDMAIGFSHHETGLVVTALVMCLLAAGILYSLQKNRTN